MPEEQWKKLEEVKGAALRVIGDAKSYLEKAEHDLKELRTRNALNALSEAEQIVGHARRYAHQAYELKRGIHGGK
jgi:hypothetical protein